MALPDNQPSQVATIADFLPPDDEPYAQLVSYEDGGIDVSDPSKGLMGYKWRIRVNDDNIILERDSTKSYVLFEGIGDIKSIDLAFDQNMNPAVAYDKSNGNSYLYWFDASIGDYTTSVFFNCRSPRLSLDDKRIESLQTSDIIFGYIKSNGDLVYRQQRDRYTIERILQMGIPDHLYLMRIGMTKNNRLRFQVTQDMSLPLCSGGY